MENKESKNHLTPSKASLRFDHQIFKIYTYIRSKWIGKLTAVSSIVLSSGSTLPPGKEVSPAYVLSEADRLSGKLQYVSSQ
jgi:hypothetical protein